MTLATHAIVGAAVISFIPSYPILGVVLAFGSHLLIDAIPHYDYTIHSASVHPQIGAKMKFDKALLADVLSIGFDGLAGFLLAFLFFHRLHITELILVGAFFGMLPDALQFVYGHFKHEPLVTLQRFHEWIHSKNHLEEHPERKWPAIGSQVLFVFLVVFVTLTIHTYFLQ